MSENEIDLYLWIGGGLLGGLAGGEMGAALGGVCGFLIAMSLKD